MKKNLYSLCVLVSTVICSANVEGMGGVTVSGGAFHPASGDGGTRGIGALSPHPAGGPAEDAED